MDFDVKKTYFSTGFLVRNFCQLSHFMTQRTIIRMAAPERQAITMTVSQTDRMTNALKYIL